IIAINALIFSLFCLDPKKVKSEPALILAGLCQNSEWKKVESHLQTLHDLLTKWIRTGDENPPSEYQSQDYK
ncbi:hypothetical protein NL380_27535, partial [Klebsiella pneumoniae]|nr:hypothetical protein [Klebsiella pneumoniae]